MSQRQVLHDVELGFLPVRLTTADPDHPGLLRSTGTSGPYEGDRVELHSCLAVDASESDLGDVDLLSAGFDTVDLSPLAELQRTLSQIRSRGAITDRDAAAVRSAFDGAVLRTPGGLELTVLDLAGEGLFLRASGPNRRSVVEPGPDGMNGHGAATSVHADQDVFGTPLRQIMDGRAPSLFRHDSPDGGHEAALMLVNLWIPLQQVVQPLVLADGRSIDRRRHQVRFGLRTESFLERDDDMSVNDIWNFLHDAEQRWYFRSEMDQRSAYVFDTLSTAHGAGVLPGEQLAESCWCTLEQLEAAAAVRDVQAVAAAVPSVAPPPVPLQVPAPLREAIGQMADLIEQARTDPAALCDPSGEDWIAAARSARERVVRRSVELRLVVSVAEPSTS